MTLDVDISIQQTIHSNTSLQDGDTVLHIATECGFDEIASMLIAQGTPLHVVNSDGRTARDLAEDNGYIDIVAMIDHARVRRTNV